MTDKYELVDVSNPENGLDFINPVCCNGICCNGICCDVACSADIGCGSGPDISCAPNYNMCGTVIDPVTR